jgi:MerR family transcriptional regulator, redox-sensitive transcriptional activator SoxR
MKSAQVLLSIGELTKRSGVAQSALRFYEEEGLISSQRSEGGQRRYEREMLRRVAFIRAAQTLGISLASIKDSLRCLPEERTPTKADWERLSRAWAHVLDARIAALQSLRTQLTSCIGCGCLSLKSCALYNAEDKLASTGAGAAKLRFELN